VFHLGGPFRSQYISEIGKGTRVKRAHFGPSTVGNTTYNAQREYRQTINSTEVTYSDIKNAQKAYEDQKIALTMFQNMKRRF
jgi:hypothetical protein